LYVYGNNLRSSWELWRGMLGKLNADLLFGWVDWRWADLC
jgi:hypothetical protein